jgi:hypothetical protein
MIDEKKRPERRTVQYWFEDGIWEMGIGAMNLLCALYFLIETIIPPRTLWRVLWGVTAIPVFFLGAKFMARAVRSSKEKWTYPRAGFISYRRQNDLKRSRRFSWRGAILGCAYGAAFNFLREISDFSAYLVLLALSSGLVLLYIAANTSETRFFLLSAVIIGAGLFLAYVRVEFFIQLGIFFAIEGVALVVSGRTTFGQFVSHNPIPNGDET